MRWPLTLLSVPVLGALLLGVACQRSGPPADATLPPTDPEVSVATQCEEGPVPGEAPLRLLTRSAYNHSVEDLLGDTTQPALAFPPENQSLGFNNNVEAHQASPLLVSAMMNAAEGIAERVVQTRLDQIAPCGSGALLECGQAFVRSIGQVLFRRPLELDELQSFDRLFAATLGSGPYADSVSVVLQALLQSPQFLYRVESVRPPGVEVGPALLGSYELATRLSYFLTDSTPDAALLEAAQLGALSSKDEVEAQARRLVLVPRARAMVADFHYQWLGMAELGRIIREQSGTVAPADFGALLQQSLASYVEGQFWGAGGFEALFSSDQIFLNAKLASFYGHTLAGESFSAVSEPGQRFGLLTQPALMAALAHPDQTAPVFRGVFLREHFLCEDVPAPPPNVNAVAPNPDPKATTRERFRQHTESSACSVCHALIDPVGFGFENYDQFGRYRTVENGLPVDASGALNGLAEVALNGTFSGIADLAGRIATSASARDCLSKQWFRFAAGRAETQADLCSLGPVQANFRQTGDLPEILVQIAISDAFRYRAPYVLSQGATP